MTYYLYIKTHNITGLKYLGYTSNKNPYRYKGSGLYWKNHLKKHGSDITTEIVYESENLVDIQQKGREYSEKHSVVESSEWANLKPETGIGGAIKGINIGRLHSETTKQKISRHRRGKGTGKRGPLSEKRKDQISLTLKGRKRPFEEVEKQKRTLRENPKKMSEENKAKLRKPKSAEGRRNMKNAYHKGCLGGCWVTNGDIEYFSVDATIPVGYWKGRKIKPKPPSQKGKFWVTDGSKNKMSTIIPEGWWKGRTKK